MVKERVEKKEIERIRQIERELDREPFGTKKFDSLMNERNKIETRRFDRRAKELKKNRVRMAVAIHQLQTLKSSPKFIDLVNKLKISEDEADRTLNSLLSEGILYEPRPGEFRTLSDTLSEIQKQVQATDEQIKKARLKDVI